VIQPFFGGVLVRTENAYDRVVNGVVEVTSGLQGMIAGKFPRTSVGDLPFVGDKSRDSAGALWALYEKGLFADEYNEVKPLRLFVYPQVALQTRRPVRNLDEFKGIKLSVSDKVTAESVEKLGGAPVTMAPFDIYASLSRGVIDGAAMQWTGVFTFKLQEVSSNHLDVQLGSSSGYVFMNKDSFAKLPAKPQKAIDDNSGYKSSREFGQFLDKLGEDARTAVKGMPGHAVASLDAAETARWKERVTPVIEDWVKRTPNGAAVLDAFKAEVAKSMAMN
jgi:TRAP-type C4-dicarboxylate transport system substrate-binding protein